MKDCSKPITAKDLGINPLFKAEVGYNGVRHVLRVTHDDRLWSEIELDNLDEIRKTIFALQLHLNTRR